jgi:purine-binding chemotaxis protein CheW
MHRDPIRFVLVLDDVDAGSLISGQGEAPSFLIVASGRARVAIRLDFVVETMRPPAFVAVAGTPAFVRGAAIVRGAAVPVVDLRAVLFDELSISPTRVITLRTGARQVALLVDRVIGVARLERGASAQPVPLLGRAAAGNVAALGALDRDLLFVLEGALALDEDVFRLAEAAT